MMTRCLSLMFSAVLCASCATAPRTYKPPDSTKLKTSTQRVSNAVDKAHQHAREARGRVDEAAKTAARVQAETKKLKEVPDSIIQGQVDLQNQLAAARDTQTKLESDLLEADAAKAQVEKDKTEYFGSAQGLANDATTERNARIKAEKALSWYRWHSLFLKLAGGLVVLVIVVLAFLWFTGRLAGLASKFL